MVKSDIAHGHTKSVVGQGGVPSESNQESFYLSVGHTSDSSRYGHEMLMAWFFKGCPLVVLVSFMIV